jgi:2',3'-cyclic-nucleotide 2'-phosphodiesterase (5'-nucleotidase family)
MVGAMNRMGYDALTIGQGELRLGSSQLLEVMDLSSFPFLSANLTKGEGGPPLSQASTSYLFDRHRVSIIGVTSPDATDIHQLEPGEIAVLDPLESVRQQVSETADQSEVVIVLSYLGTEQDVQLAQQVQGIDIIVGSSTGSTPEEAIQVHPTGTVIVQAGKRGEWLGILDLVIDRQGHIVSYESRSKVLSEDIPEDSELGTWLESVRPTPTPTSQPREGES